MAFKFIAFASLVAAASAGILQPAPLAYHATNVAPLSYNHAAPLAYAAPVAKAVIADPYEHSYDHNPQYSYSYNVHDTLTGDAKSQQETRNGDVVEGSYSFIEADGSRRVVHYTADDHNGFNAVVEKQPAQVAVKAVTPVHVKTVAPVHVKTITPLAYAHPVAPVTYQHSSPLLGAPAPFSHSAYSAPAYAAPAISYHH